MLLLRRAGALLQWLKLSAWKVGGRGFEPHSGLQISKKQNVSPPLTRIKVYYLGSLRDLVVACSASDRQGSNFESCVGRAVSSHLSHHPREVHLAEFSLYVHKRGIKPNSFYFISCWKSCFRNALVVGYSRLGVGYSYSRSVKNVCQRSLETNSTWNSSS